MLFSAAEIMPEIMRQSEEAWQQSKGRTQMLFSIDPDNNITAHGSDSEAAAATGQPFSNQKELAAIIESSPVSRLVDVWNSLPGHAPVKKFENRKIAVGRIWKAIQSLQATEEAAGSTAAAAAAPETATVAAQPDAVLTTNSSMAKQTTKHAKRSAGTNKRAGKPEKASKREKPVGARDGTKQATILGLMKQRGGFTLKELMKATGLQAHSVRGFISGAVGKKLGIPVKSTKDAGGERTYAI